MAAFLAKEGQTQDASGLWQEALQDSIGEDYYGIQDVLNQLVSLLVGERQLHKAIQQYQQVMQHYLRIGKP